MLIKIFFMENIKSFLVCVLAIIIASFSSAISQDRSDVYRSENFSTSEESAINIRTSGGFIEVYGHSDAEARVDMIVRRGNKLLTLADTDLSDFEIEIDQQGDVITASAKRTDGGTFSGWFGSGSNISISFVVYAPHGSLVDGRTSGGSVKAVDFNNNVSLRTSGGSVTAELITGDVNLRTSGGSITMRDLNGRVQARTSGGSIRADGLNGLSDLRTSGGSIRLQTVAGGVSARTSGGSIRAEMVDFIDDLDFRTSGGSIHIKIPETNHFNVDLRGNRVDMELRNFTGSTERNRITGQIGDGGPLLAARTSGGRVSVEY